MRLVLHVWAPTQVLQAKPLPPQAELLVPVTHCPWALQQPWQVDAEHRLFSQIRWLLLQV
jgi:hypothetical protein